MSTSTLSCAEIVRTYVESVWNNGDIEVAKRFLADRCWRHDTDFDWEKGSGQTVSIKEFSMEDQIKRLAYAVDVAGKGIDFHILELIESGEYVTMIWDLVCTPNDQTRPAIIEAGYSLDEHGRYKAKGIEVFHIVDEKIVEIWVAQGPSIVGHWGDTKTEEAHVPSPQPIPPSDVIRNYVTRMWNKRDPSAIDDYLGESCWRHDAGEPDRQFMQFDRDFQRQRAREGYATGSFDFQIVKLLESGNFVTMIWNLSYIPNEEIMAKLRDTSVVNEQGEILLKGIEVFCVIDGMIVEVWVAQNYELKGHWGPSMT